MAVFDIHQHTHSAWLIAPSSLEAKRDYEYRIRMMDEHGIGQAAMMPMFDYTMANGIEDTKRVNDGLAEFKSKHSDRFPVAMGTVEPRHGEQSLAEIDRIARELVLDGIVWHHRHQAANIDDKVMFTYLRKIATLNVPVFIHLFGESTHEAPWRLERLLAEFPGVTFVALDGFSALDRSRQMTFIAKRHSNVVFDTALMFPLGRMGEQFVAAAGAERLLLGTDLNHEGLFYTRMPYQDEIADYRISEEDKAKILGENARRLLGLSS